MADRQGRKQEIFSESRIALMKELRNHDELCERLTTYDYTEEWPDMLGEIAAYVGIIMDDVYTPADLENLHDILWKKLRAKRGADIIIV